jgi:hypothetical protein
MWLETLFGNRSASPSRQLSLSRTRRYCDAVQCALDADPDTVNCAVWTGHGRSWGHLPGEGERLPFGATEEAHAGSLHVRQPAPVHPFLRERTCHGIRKENRVGRERECTPAIEDPGEESKRGQLGMSSARCLV